MKRARFTEDQIIGVLKEHEAGAKTADLARKHGISHATLYNWTAKYGGMDASEAKRLKALEDENAKLKCWRSRCSTRPCSVSCSQKNGRARRQARRSRASEGRARPVGAAGLQHRLGGSDDDPLPFSPAGGHGAARAPAGSGERTAPVWIPSSLRPPVPGRRAVGPQPDLSALPRGEADVEEATRPAARGRHQGADPRRSKGERTCRN